MNREYIGSIVLVTIGNIDHVYCKDGKLRPSADPKSFKFYKRHSNMMRAIGNHLFYVYGTVRSYAVYTGDTIDCNGKVTRGMSTSLCLKAL